MRVYISGPISGVENPEVAFAEAEKIIEAEPGFEAINPIGIGIFLEAELGRKPTWQEYMRADIKAMLSCDAVYMLPGWMDSKGARIEAFIAKELGFKRAH